MTHLPNFPTIREPCERYIACIQVELYPLTSLSPKKKADKLMLAIISDQGKLQDYFR